MQMRSRERRNSQGIQMKNIKKITNELIVKSSDNAVLCAIAHANYKKN